MDSSVESKALRFAADQRRFRSEPPLHCNPSNPPNQAPYHAHHRHHHDHHHHHYHVSPHCPLHSYMLHFNNHSTTYPGFDLHPLSQHPLPDAQNLWPSESKEAVPDTLMMHEENVELEQEEDEDPVFVLTDEWREFFAKSEAKRRLEKKQAKKKGKK